MYGALRRALFLVEPERAHRMATAWLRMGQEVPAARAAMRGPTPSPRLRVSARGRKLPGPLGMAAGFDKECVAYHALLALGFGHVEVGTVTPRPQAGNEPPRMQRLPALEALVNRLGFPGPGMEACARRLERRKPDGLVGANIGPNKSTQPENVGEDLAACARTLAPHAGYLAVNVSSPNTPGLRTLQKADAISWLVRRTLEGAQDGGRTVPILVKLHPDVPDEDLVRVARSALSAGASGIIAVNTTRSRPPGLDGAMEGGLSGAPLRERAVRAVAALRKATGRDVPIIGVGGVSTGSHAMDLVRAGATLVQAYTGFVYRGPRFPALVHAEMVAELDKAGLDRLEEAVGTGA